MTRGVITAVSLAVLLVIGAGAYLYTQKSDEAASDISSATEGRPVVGKAADEPDEFDVEITFDGEKFIPSEITIPKSTRVRFLNNSDIPVWPASAVHPTHSIYPEKNETNCLGSSFDACRALKNGEYFNFTFEVAGEWRYHDHIKAFKTGVITVTE